MTARRSVTLFMLLFVALCSAKAQDYLYATGSPVYSTSLPIDHGIVNVNNGDIHLEIPVATKPQRGDFALDEKLIYDSRIWKIVQNGSSYLWQPTNVPNSSGGWTFSSGTAANSLSYGIAHGSLQKPVCSNASTAVLTTAQPDYVPPSTTVDLYQYFNWVWTDPSGTSHFFPNPVTSKSSACQGEIPNVPSGSGVASDGSGYTISISNYTNAVITDVQGRNYTPSSSVVTDRNKNSWTQDSSGNLIDTSGQTIVLTTTSGNTTDYAVLGVGGTRQHYTVTYTTVSFNTAFSQSDVGEVSGSFSAIQSIGLPDGSFYHFSYDSGTSSGHYGELTSMTLPTGGVVTFNYNNFLDSYNNQNRWLSSIEKDGGTTAFTPALISKCSSSAGCQEAVTVHSPAGNDTVYTFNLDKAGQAAGKSWISGIKTYQGTSASGTLLRSTSTNYTYNSVVAGWYSGATYTNETFSIPVSITNYVTLSDTNYTTETLTSLWQSTPLPAETKSWDFYSSTGYAPTTDTVYSYGVLNSPTSVTVKDGAGNQISSVSYGLDSVGNQTSQHQWINTSGQTFDSSTAFDATGFAISHTDPNGVTGFAPDSTETFATKTTYPAPNSGALLATQAQYDISTGAITGTTDENGNQTTYKNFDVFNRPGEADYPDGGRSTFSYTSTVQSGIEQAMDTRANNTQFLADSYGRPIKKLVGNGQSTNPWFTTDTCYDTSGRVSFTSYPYAGNGSGTTVCSGAGDQFSYDALGRTTQISHADGFVQQFNYKGRAVESIDENGVTKITQSDAFGRTTAVCEISSNANMPASGLPVNCGLDYPGTGFLTTYAYNDANHTTTVTQGAQTRVFATDSLGRTVSTQEPESGLTTYTYTYNSKGLLVTRVRPRANQASGARTTTSTQYDSIGRVLDVTYSDGSPELVYIYDQSSGGAAANAVGRLAEAATSFPAGTAATSFTYDTMGRTTQSVTCLPGQCGTSAIPIGYAYDHVGNLVAEGGPAIGTISYSYDLASSLATESLTPPSQATKPVLSNVQAGPFGPTSYQLGNGLYQVFQYDVDGRRDRGWTCRGSSQQQCTGGTDLYGYGLDMKGSQLTNSSDSIMNNYNNYQYDEFNRLKSLNGGTNGLSLSWVYDRYGNRWQQNGSGVGSAPQPQYSYNASNNRNTAYLYDDAGDVNNDVSNGYSYDADGNSVTNGPTRYNYDALGNRFEKLPVSGDPTWYIYDAFGRQLEVVNGRTDALLETRLTLNGSPLAFLSAGGSLSFEHPDWLGTVRATSNVSGNFSSTFLSLPFGDGFTPNGTDVDTGHFADLERDASTDTDHAEARNYGEAGGRWMSPDPYSGSYEWSNPQSMNRYSYVLNNPLALFDPSGLDGTGQCPPESADGSVENCTVIGTPDPPPPTSDSGGFFDPFVDFGDAIASLFGFGGGPSFHGSVHPRPNAAPSNMTTPTSCSASGAFSLDYSQPLHNGGTQTSQQHIMQRHGGNGLSGVSRYNGNFGQIQLLNSVTYLFGSQTVQGNSIVLQFSLPQVFSRFGLYSYIGRDAGGQPTSTNRLVTRNDCQTVVTSYPIADPVPVPYP